MSFYRALGNTNFFYCWLAGDKTAVLMDIEPIDLRRLNSWLRTDAIWVLRRRCWQRIPYASAWRKDGVVNWQFSQSFYSKSISDVSSVWMPRGRLIDLYMVRNGFFGRLWKQGYFWMTISVPLPALHRCCWCAYVYQQILFVVGTSAYFPFPFKLGIFSCFKICQP
jgi:hypothetical protein